MEGLMQSKTNMEANESLNSTKLPPNHTPNPQQPKIDAPNKSKKENVLLNTICLSQIFNRKIIQLPMRTGYI